MERDWVINSHRGAFHEGLLENTIEAYTQAAQEGANCMECDLHITKDRQIVLIHNDDIDGICRLATRIPEEHEFHERPTGLVKTHTLAYLKAIEFPRNAHLLSLPEFLQFLEKAKVGANLELKEGGYVDLILQTIADAHLSYDLLKGPVVCTTSNVFAMVKMRKHTKKYDIPLYDYTGKKGLALGLQATFELGDFYGKLAMRWCHSQGFWGFMTHYRHLPVFRLPFAHAMHLKFCPRVPDDEQLVNAYIDAGVDGFETDNVQFIKNCIEKKGFHL